MMVRKSALAAIFLLALPVHSQVAKVQDSPREFVQNFYNWYVTIAQKSNASDLAIKRKGSFFSPELSQALLEDSAAQAKVSELIVGIDWDPFLNSQDPEDHYLIGKVTKKGDRFFVCVHGVRSGQKRTEPDVIAELMKKDNSWLFVNFHNPGKGDLLSSLKNLRKARQKGAKP